MVALVMTSCTNRKRKAVPCDQQISSLASAPLGDLAAAWAHRLANASERFPATAIYGGRAFREASMAARLADACLLVVSAGLGLVEAAAEVPPYACTVSHGAADSVAARVTGAFRVEEWWAALREVSPFSRSLTDLIVTDDDSVLIALPETYLSMVARELCSLPTSALARVRLFTRAPRARVAPGLLPFLMPYDDRLDGPDSPVRGTRSDFAARALHHFVQLGSAGSVADDGAAVARALSGWRMPAQPMRIRLDDAELVGLMRRYWGAVGGCSSRLLRLFRDDLGIACEQSRFAMLARRVRSELG